MSASDDIADLGAVEAGRRVAEGSLSPVALTEAALDRIDRLDGRLHAFACRLNDQALAQARQLEAEARNGRLRSALHGVPVAVKDLCDIEGVPTAAGLPMFRAGRATADSTVVARLKEAGCVIVGKTELSEGALALHHPEVTLPVNPWRGDLWTGSSSSGSGVAVAAGMVAAAIGSDTGGSIRFPALCNGLVGVKTTWGRVSRHGVFPLSWTLDHVGPLAREVSGAAAMLQIIAGSDANDMTSLTAPVPDYLSAVKAGVSGLRIGFDEAYATAGVMPETVSAMARAIDILTGAGAVLTGYSMPDTRAANAAWTPICLSEAYCVHEDLKASDQSGYSPAFRAALEMGRAVTGADYARANIVRRDFAGRLDRVFEDVDLLLVPVTPNPVPTVEEFAQICPDPDGLEQLIRFTCIYDVSGHPTITLPAGRTAAGGPIAFQLVAPHLGEAALFRAGQVCEEGFGPGARPGLR